MTGEQVPLSLSWVWAEKEAVQLLHPVGLSGYLNLSYKEERVSHLSACHGLEMDFEPSKAVLKFWCW